MGRGGQPGTYTSTGMMQLQRKVKAENFFGTTNRKQKDPYKKQMEESNVELLKQQRRPASFKLYRSILCYEALWNA